jgi:hypothetical protein
LIASPKALFAHQSNENAAFGRSFVSESPTAAKKEPPINQIPDTSPTFNQTPDTKTPPKSR